MWCNLNGFNGSYPCIWSNQLFSSSTGKEDYVYYSSGQQGLLLGPDVERSGLHRALTLHSEIRCDFSPKGVETNMWGNECSLWGNECSCMCVNAACLGCSFLRGMFCKRMFVWYIFEVLHIESGCIFVRWDRSDWLLLTIEWKSICFKLKCLSVFTLNREQLDYRGNHVVLKKRMPNRLKIPIFGPNFNPPRYCVYRQCWCV